MNTSHYYDNKPQSESKRSSISFRLFGIDFEFTTDSGVFSKSGLDFGTQLMLNTVALDLKDNKLNLKKVLDFGCGYGVVGVVLKRIFPGIVISMTDINTRALDLSKDNAAKNLVKYANIFESDALDNVEEIYDYILTNPPIRAGKSKVFEFYERSFDHLSIDGVLYVVIQKKQGAKSSIEKLTKLFGNCEILAKKSGYFILKSVRISN